MERDLFLQIVHLSFQHRHFVVEDSHAFLHLVERSRQMEDLLIRLKLKTLIIP